MPPSTPPTGNIPEEKLANALDGADVDAVAGKPIDPKPATAPDAVPETKDVPAELAGHPENDTAATLKAAVIAKAMPVRLAPDASDDDVDLGEGIKVASVPTHIAMKHKDGDQSTSDLFEKTPDGRLMVPVAQAELMKSHGFVVATKGD